MSDYAIRHYPTLKLPTGSWIQFRVLTLKWNDKRRDVRRQAGLRFEVHKPPTDGSQDSIEKFVANNLDYTFEAKRFSSTPWDIDLPRFDKNFYNSPRIMVLLLDNALPWRFTPGSRGIASKRDNQEENSSLHYVHSDRVARLATPSGVPDGCRMLFWSVLSRPKADGEDTAERRGFNFYVDLIDAGNGRTMPTIFDPNVPDNGGASIP